MWLQPSVPQLVHIVNIHANNCNNYVLIYIGIIYCTCAKYCICVDMILISGSYYGVSTDLSVLFCVWIIIVSEASGNNHP